MSRDNEEAQMEATAAPLMEHLVELRRRLIWCVGGFLAGFILSFAFATPIFNALVVPFQWAVDWHGMTADDVQFIYTAPQEFFFTQIKIGAFGGLVLAFPLIATQLYLFIAPGLYANERGAFLPFLLATPILFLIGAALVYFMIIPMAMWFFLSLEQTGGEGVASIQHLPRVSEYLSLIMTLIFAFGLVFQLPVALTLLSRAGLVTPEGLANKRKYAIVIAFVAAAILTPPDPMTQLGLAVPTILLYELSIFMARRFQPPPSEYDEEDDEDDDPEPGDAAPDAAKAGAS
ncbi:MAG: twin-arginine translocase subunit TatC [Roseitalea sp.]|uniref:Sec-independent protein translocase protein TatC n=2 Tax=Oceaniradius stylonematis TaxID=2184161 RepID=A0A3A8AEJ7_9HYPH|nr:twin-arginine translocase subunit TatC [Oceaniradius stylonematis]MBO6552526.1 twin-arginine translocase subunit TatC [Roseitalea sp.]MBO6950554.1 twin-arginine translocase subunit TatC [Rhizobiaceae bacterium]MBO6591459.1 twin-arginine translocase subunit TatC [Roseitalea sp.]MBO6599314.1 twin-arginine translocase subunit TatC [Roseitalea sp.]MBO6612197.1 twin-arginine translocase subunit TatC [Roseitalea sp.]